MGGERLRIFKCWALYFIQPPMMEDLSEYSKKPDDFIHKDITEHEAITYLLNAFEGSESGNSNLNIFNNLLYGEYYLENSGKYSGCYCLKNFLTKEIGLDAENKPGEIDILLIPFDSEKIFYEKSSAFEVKITKPKLENINKGANSDGYSQVMGLVKLGFPFVGLIHVVLSVPLTDASKRDIKFMKRPANIEDVENSKIPSIEDYEMIKWDWLPFYAESNQMKRMLRYDIPKYVGLKSISLHFSEDNSIGVGQSEDFKAFETGCLNPHRKHETIAKIKNHHEKSPNLYRKIYLKFPS